MLPNHMVRRKVTFTKTVKVLSKKIKKFDGQKEEKSEYYSILLHKFSCLYRHILRLLSLSLMG